MHDLWLQITSDPHFAGAHHYHVVGLALDELKLELTTERRAELLAKLDEDLRSGAKDSKDSRDDATG
jgi:hypothetical protein